MRFSCLPAELQSKFVELNTVFIFIDPQLLNNSAYESEYEYKAVVLSISAGLTEALISKIWLRACD